MLSGLGWYRVSGELDTMQMALGCLGGCKRLGWGHSRVAL